MSKIIPNKDAFPRVKPSLSWLEQAVRESALELNASMSTEQDTDSTQLKVTFIPRSRSSKKSGDKPESNSCFRAELFQNCQPDISSNRLKRRINHVKNNLKQGCIS